MPAERPVRVRIAPSPTGDPHVGTAYIALFNYVFAKSKGGKFVLRIEDTDQTRARSDSEQMIFDALHWCGITWDEGPDVGGPFAPYRQSERSQHYKDAAAQLIEKGEAYRCFCTPDRLAKVRLQQQAEKKNPGYDRHCRDLDPAHGAARAGAGEAHVVRMKVPLSGPIIVKDELRGDISIEATQIDDQVLLKTDGLPTYHLANVVDDHLMEITHVCRAEEWISSTPKHVLLYKAFGWEPPLFFHMPLLRNSDKSKISKRKNPVSINYYRDIGILPHALLNFLGLMGWSFGDDKEKFTLDEMIGAFAWDKVSLGGPVFNIDKLTWLNEKYIHELDYEKLADTVIDWRLNKSALVKILPLVRERIKKLDELVPMIEYFFSGDLDYAPVLADMKVPDVSNADVGKALLELVDALDTREGFTAPMLEEEAKKWAEAKAWKPKFAFSLLRLALTARKASPPLFETMSTLGKEIARRRLRKAAETIAAQKPVAPPAQKPEAASK
ncbi:MAG TPA: glutamate--tRNA ligase [Kofleriaceae bacterium]|jgi:glutamyl-tRNA synthetase